MHLAMNFLTSGCCRNQIPNLWYYSNHFVRLHNRVHPSTQQMNKFFENSLKKKQRAYLYCIEVNQISSFKRKILITHSDVYTSIQLPKGLLPWICQFRLFWANEFETAGGGIEQRQIVFVYILVKTFPQFRIVSDCLEPFTNLTNATQVLFQQIVEYGK